MLEARLIERIKPEFNMRGTNIRERYEKII